VALVNPLRTHRLARRELARTKTDSIDGLQIAPFGAQKRPMRADLPKLRLEELRELARLLTGLMQEMVNQLRAA
jgi:transposase